MTATAEHTRDTDDTPGLEMGRDVAGSRRPSRARGAFPWWLAPIGRCIGVFAASRCVALAAMVMGLAPTRSPLTVGFHFWDGGWWIGLIENGYPREIVEQSGRAAQSTIAFFPGYPLIARGFEATFGLSPLGAGVLVSTLAGAASAILIWFLVRELLDELVADRAVALFCFFPSAFVLSAAYSESVMVAFTAGSMLAAVRRRWLLAGLLAAAASATRPTAIMLVPALGIGAMLAIRKRREWIALVAPLLAPLGMVAYFLFLRLHTGELGAWFRVQNEGWGYDSPDWGTRALRHTADLLFVDPLSDVNVITGTLAAIYIVVGLYLIMRWKPPAVVTVFTVLVSLQVLTGGLPSRPRYILNAFPLIVAVAWRLRTAWSYTMMLGVSAGLLGVYTLMSTSTTLSIP